MFHIAVSYAAPWLTHHSPAAGALASPSRPKPFVSNSQQGSPIHGIRTSAQLFASRHDVRPRSAPGPSARRAASPAGGLSWQHNSSGLPLGDTHRRLADLEQQELQVKMAGLHMHIMQQRTC
jgi:hypothetical protein